MAYTKTNLNETTETVAEQNTRAYSKTVWNESTPITADKLNKIENGIANALDTTTGGTVNGKLTVKGHIQSDGGNFYSNKNGGNKPVIEVFNGDKNGSAVVYSAGALTVLAGGEAGSVVVQNTNNTDEHAVVSADQGVILYANLQNGWENRKTVELTKGGRFKLNNNSLELSPNNSGYARIGLDGDSQDVFISNINNNWFRLKGDKTITYGGHKVYTAFDKPTAAEIGALPISGGTLTGKIDVPGESTFYNDTYVDPWHGQLCSIKASGHVGIGGSLKVNGNLAFSNYGGSELNANIHSLALHAATGNGQIMTVGSHNVLYIGNSNTPLTLESNSNPVVNVGGNQYHMYHTGNKPTAAAIGAMGTSSPTFSGNLNQNGPGGKDWIYHINADRGTLNIAPKENGSPNWGKQIFIDRNGQLHCNGNRRVATINQENPAHHIIRYGAGMGGENGYITFSW